MDVIDTLKTWSFPSLASFNNATAFPDLRITLLTSMLLLPIRMMAKTTEINQNYPLMQKKR